MRRTTFAIMAMGAAAACRPAPERLPDVARAQASLTPDTAQARLWSEAGAAAGAGVTAAGLRVDSAPVTARAPVRIPDQANPRREQPFPQEVPAALAVLAAPDLSGPFDGPATVGAVRGEVVMLDLGQGRTLQLQAKVAGGPLRAAAGDTARLAFRSSGNPYARDDVLDLRLPNDRVIHALVGAASPVRLEVSGARLRAEQIGKPDSNTMPVAVTVGGTRRVLRPGEQAAFSEGGLTVRILASVAVQGEAAHALEGQPYRIQLLAWRTREQ